MLLLLSYPSRGKRCVAVVDFMSALFCAFLFYEIFLRHHLCRSDELLHDARREEEERKVKAVCGPHACGLNSTWCAVCSVGG